ncbi:DUF1573 domain-containing protein [Pedobacter sp. Hv1]|uniref:DUF1573 domain-containing protein n=1 Tax=Pedobacter sp. Hv1 TaxID=1740090 RepID=UPI0006D8BA6E|nr:DUF1573 domain-containing protein [Pedobacter sp. Hv1]KQC02755.1 hypothetical protein AQF98_04050 [Pedobacter sp. Hv1]
MISKTNIQLKHFLLFMLAILCVSCISKTQNNNATTNSELTNMVFKQKEYDFGNIPAEKNVSAVFEFSNTGNNALIIKEVTTSCGCTVSEWPKVPIKPNESGEIKIVYDAKDPGRFNKTVTVIYNGKDSPLELTIRGEVPYPKKEVKHTSNKSN